MAGLDTALIVTQLIESVVNGLSPVLKRKARAALLSKKRQILTKLTSSRVLMDKLETWYSRKNQADAETILRSAGFGGPFEKYLKEGRDHLKIYDSNRSMLNMYEAKQQDTLGKLNQAEIRLENGSPFAANKIAAQGINAANKSDADATSIKKGY